MVRNSCHELTGAATPAETWPEVIFYSEIYLPAYIYLIKSRWKAKKKWTGRFKKNDMQHAEKLKNLIREKRKDKIELGC